MRRCPQCKGQLKVWVLAPVRNAKAFSSGTILVNWDEKLVPCRLCKGAGEIEGDDDDDDVGERSEPIADRFGGFFRLAYVGGRDAGRRS